MATPDELSRVAAILCPFFCKNMVCLSRQRQFYSKVATMIFWRNILCLNVLLVELVNW